MSALHEQAPEPAQSGRDNGQSAVYLRTRPDTTFAVLHPAAERRSAGGAGVVLCPPFGWDELCAHRAYLHWAERLAAAGHAALRLDLPGSGESGGSPRDPERIGSSCAAISTAAAWLRATAGCERIVALGVGLGGLLACAALSDGAPIDDLLLWSVPAKERRCCASCACSRRSPPPK